MGEPLISQNVSKGVISALASAFLEWCLIFLLFIDGFFSYLITKFARYCELQIPCLLCSRIDHVLGNGKDGGYQDLICSNHKLEISSLVLCRIHNKIVDVHGICESCLFSFATINKSNAETYRLLVGKLGPDPHKGLEQDAFFREENLGSSGSKYCSCCSANLMNGGHAQKMIRTKSIGSEADEFNLPLLVPVEHSFGDLKIRDEFTESLRVSHVAKSGVDPLSHIEYKKVKITSDSESEVPFSDDDDGARALIRFTDDSKEVLVDQEPRIITLDDEFTSEKVIKVEITSDRESHVPLFDNDDGVPDDLKEVFPVQCVDQEPRPIKLDDDLTSENLKTSTSTPESSKTESEIVSVQSVDQEPHNIQLNDDLTSESLKKSASTPESSKTESEIVSVQSVDQEPHIIQLNDDLTSENLINSGFAPKHSNDANSEVQSSAVDPHGCESIASCAAAIGHGLEELNWQQVEDKSEPSITSELITFDDVPSSSNLMGNPDEDLRETLDASATSGEGQESVIKNGEMCKAGSSPYNEREIDIDNGGISNMGSGTATQSETGKELNPVGPQIPINLELGDAYKIALGTRGKQLSGKFSEQRSMKDSTKLGEDLKQLLSQLTSARGMELPLSDMSPRISGAIDEWRASDASSAIGMHIFQRRVSLERNESGLSMDGSTISEIDGETVVDRLKRQVEHDKKLMGTLYKELEEERNASSIAANQAMAMITRLQEEKAALHMEALQCLRMMEEQAEYDEEALQKANDLLSEKEKEIQDLEAGLELYRNKYGEIPMLDNIVEPLVSSNVGTTDDE